MFIRKESRKFSAHSVDDWTTSILNQSQNSQIGTDDEKEEIQKAKKPQQYGVNIHVTEFPRAEEQRSDEQLTEQISNGFEELLEIENSCYMKYSEALYKTMDVDRFSIQPDKWIGIMKMSSKFHNTILNGLEQSSYDNCTQTNFTAMKFMKQCSDFVRLLEKQH